MAIYQYKCSACNKDVEIERPMSEPAGPDPKCDCGYPLARVWSATSAIFRGGGWGGQ
jgi:putative FmdB family regulatory protein